ncbi:MAG: acyl carrier protein [Acidobacteria bacterium]|nr:acyl carrier protein [Acidobacteriota bacterium]
MDRRATLIDIIRRVSKKNVSPEADESLFDSGLLDSFALPDMVSGIEEAFAVKIPDADLHPRKFDSIERIEAYLESLN